MNKNEDATLLTEEELDNVTGGADYVYELVHGQWGDYYHCVTTDNKKWIDIPVEKWDKWLKDKSGNNTFTPKK